MQSSYNHFDLLVEIGSALGLWLGLSAITVITEILAFLQVVENIRLYSTLSTLDTQNFRKLCFLVDLVVDDF